MKFSGQRRTVIVCLLCIMVATLVAPAPRAPVATAAPLDFTKPATTFTGPATVTCFTSPDSSNLVVTDLLRHAKKEMLIMVYAITNYVLVKEIHAALVRNSSMVINIIVSWKWASASERDYTRACFYNLSQNAAFGNNLFLYYSESVDLEFTHAKFMVYDREVVVVESCNWAKSGVPPDKTSGNREWGVAIRQAGVVNYFVETFSHDLLLLNVEPYVPNAAHKKTLTLDGTHGSYPAPFTNQTFTGSMSIQCVLSPDNDIGAIKALIQSATTTLDIQEMYIRADWGGSPNQFLQEVIAARARGVTCRVIMDIKDDQNYPVNSTLVAAGVGVAWQDTDHWGASGDWLHNKGAIADGNKVLISSINWSNESVSQNREAGVIITHSAVAGFFASIYQYDWEHGEYQGGLNVTLPPPIPGFPWYGILLALVLVLVPTLVLRHRRRLRN